LPASTLSTFVAPATAFPAKYAQARAQNDLDTLAVTCGEAVGLLRDRPSAESIVKSMAAQAADLLHNAGKLNFTSPS